MHTQARLICHVTFAISWCDDRH